MDKHPYYDYYNSAINQGTNGFKLVLGGTGLGKTSGIVDVVQYAPTNGRQFIYCANRIQLLNEMAEKLKIHGVKHLHLRSDREAVLETIDSNEFQALLHSPIIQKAKPSRKSRLTYPKLLKNLDNIKKMKSELQESQMFQSTLDEVMRFFQAVLMDSPKATYEELTENTAIQTLFPYIAFKRHPETKVLLVTIQKAFRGFFNGRTIINISRLTGKDGNHIIFLDEFDFLENELIGLLCDTKQIEQPFQLVEFFYNRIKNHKLPLQDYPTVKDAPTDINPTARKRIEDIIQIVDKLQNEAQISFPTITQFTSSLPKREAAIFQTNHTVTSGPLYLKQTDRSFQIVTDEINDDGSAHLKAIRLFDAIHDASSRIVYLFKELENESPIIYEEMLRHCFQYTDFFRSIPRITQLPRPPHRQNTRFDHLLESGYGLYEIHDLQQVTDVQEVAFRHYALYTTPEKILHDLAKNNLVFGLSATADIPRYVHNFSINWLQKQKDITYYDVNDGDIATIQKLNAQKQERRGNKIKVVRTKTLNKKGPLAKFIKAISSDEGFGGDDPPGYRRERVEHFFSALETMIETCPPEDLPLDTNLLFLNTFAQIKYLFEKYPQQEDKIYAVNERKGNDQLFVTYDLTYQDKEFIVIFYNTSQARLVQSSELAKKQYHQLFWEKKPVVLVTQYPSAGNGVNLQYLPTSESEEETDFKNIHLLEAPYFFFGKVENETEQNKRNAVLKENFWYLAKLFEGKIVSDEWFHAILNNIRKPTLNDDYRNTMGPIADDARLNRIATYIQALGRIERVWLPMSVQTIILCPKAYEDFQLFCTRPQYEYIRDERQTMISNNLRQLLEQVTAQTKTDERLMRKWRDERLSQTVQPRCREAILALVQELEKIRDGTDNGAIKSKWERLRKAVLRHDLNGEILKEYHCVFTTPYCENETLYVNNKYETFPNHFQHSDIHPWRLNSVYSLIAENSVIRRYFEDRGYELGFNTTSNQFFTPYCYQAILIGAIGEEATKAILSNETIPLEVIPDSLYELADLKIAEQAWFVDCKNYNERTLDQFTLLPDDPAYRPKLNENDFKQLAQHKLRRIQQQFPNGKLLFINLLSGEDRPYQYFDDEFRPANSFDEASIIIIPGILNRETPNQYNKAFEQFLDHLKYRLGGKQ